MNAGWQVGDLALCVDDSQYGADYFRHPLVAGHIYQVCGVSIQPNTADQLLDLGSATTIFEFGGASAGRFRKIRPDEREACEPEFVTLLNRIKRKIGADA